MDETRKFCWHLADTIGAYKTSTVLDLIQGNSMESEYIFGKALDIAMEMSPTSCEVVQSSFLDCKNIIGASRWPRRSNWMNLERVVRSVFAIERIARVKAAQGTCWLPTLLT